jgi:predicted esterase YcpF (UPF0227 family)
LTRLLYLHGFRSSPQSNKARQTARWLAAHRPDVHWRCPQLPASPREAMAAIDGAIAEASGDALAVVGSSLGGYYATAVAERHGCPAVLLNPAVDPARDLAQHLGATTTWHGNEPFEFRTEYLDELRALRVPAITRPERYFAILAKGDEVLDWREMAARYAGCRIKLLDGGDHALSDYETAHLPDVVRFLGLV